MIMGHYAAAFAARKIDASPPLWLLFVAVQFIDIVWAVLVINGIEKVRIVPGFTASNPLDLYYMPYSHGLVATLGWSLLAYLVSRYALGQTARAAVVVAAAVVSHWVLDCLVHAPDMPIYNDAFKIGLGLWNRPAISVALEIGLLAAGLWLYLQNTRWQPGAGPRRVAIFVAVLTTLQVASPFMPAPSAATAAATTGLVTFIALAAVAWWAEKGRLVEAE